MKIAKNFEFESAHRLSDYEGKCERLHGHNYHGHIVVEGEIKDDGIVVDFSILKDIITREIKEKLDHRVFLKDTQENHSFFAHIPDDWIVWFNDNPTAENLAKTLLKRLRLSPTIPSTCRVVSVVLYETPDSFAIAE